MENLGSFVSVNLVGSIEGFPADFVNDGVIKYFAFLNKLRTFVIFINSNINGEKYVLGII